MTGGLEGLGRLFESSVSAVQRSQRILFPGAAIALFLHYRYGAPVFEGLGPRQVPSLFLSLLLGTLVYFGYKGLVHPLVWSFQRHAPVVSIPQAVFHRKACAELKIEGHVSRSTRFSQACLGHFQRSRLDPSERADTWGFNSGSHLLYMTATIGLAFLVHDVVFFQRSTPPYASSISGAVSTTTPPRDTSSTIQERSLGAAAVADWEWRNPTPTNLLSWTLLLVIGLAGGMSYDRTADYREALTLYEHPHEYYGIVSNVAAHWPEGRARLGLMRVLSYFTWPGPWLLILAVILFGILLWLKW